MKGRRFLQIFLGVLSTLFAIVLGSFALALILPLLTNATANGWLTVAINGIESLTEWLSLPQGLEYVVVLVTCALPFILTVVGANCLLFGKRGGGIAGSILTLCGVVVFSAFTGVFSKVLFGEGQTTYLIAMISTAVVYVALFVLFSILSKKGKQQATVEPTQTEQPNDAPQDIDAGEQVSTETADQQDGDVLYMAQDYSSVSDVADSTYEQPTVLTDKVLGKLKLARELYEKGALTKEEYLELVQKYLEQAQ